MDETLMTYALWGAGDITPENAKALLEEYIPDNVGTIYRPERIDREHKGLRTALDWFEHPDFLGEGGALPSTDLIQSLLDERTQNGDEVYLLALVPDSPTHEDIDFLELAQNSGITVFDLSRALDEVDLSLPAYQRPDPTKEEKAAEKEEKRGRGRPRKNPVPDTTAEVDAEVAPEAEEAEGVAVVAPVLEEPVVKETATPEGFAPVEIIEPDPLPAGFDEMIVLASAAVGLQSALDKYIEAKVNAHLASLGIRVDPDAAAKERALDSLFNQDKGTYSITETPLTVDSKPYYRSPMGMFRPATGKPKRGEQVENLTAARVKELDAEGKIVPF